MPEMAICGEQVVEVKFFHYEKRARAPPRFA
jgi:hypothetical protein